MLADPQEALPSYDALIVLSPKASRDERLRAALEPLLGAIDVARMQAANYAVDRTEDKRTPDRAAEELADAIGL